MYFIGEVWRSTFEHLKEFHCFCWKVFRGNVINTLSPDLCRVCSFTGRNASNLSFQRARTLYNIEKKRDSKLVVLASSLFKLYQNVSNNSKVKTKNIETLFSILIGSIRFKMTAGHPMEPIFAQKFCGEGLRIFIQFFLCSDCFCRKFFTEPIQVTWFLKKFFKLLPYFQHKQSHQGFQLTWLLVHQKRKTPI